MFKNDFISTYDSLIPTGVIRDGHDHIHRFMEDERSRYLVLCKNHIAMNLLPRIRQFMKVWLSRRLSPPTRADARKIVNYYAFCMGSDFHSTHNMDTMCGTLSRSLSPELYDELNKIIEEHTIKYVRRGLKAPSVLAKKGSVNKAVAKNWYKYLRWLRDILMYFEENQVNTFNILPMCRYTHTQMHLYTHTYAHIYKHICISSPTRTFIFI